MEVVGYAFSEGFFAKEFLFHKVFIGFQESGNNESGTFPSV